MFEGIFYSITLIASIVASIYGFIHWKRFGDRNALRWIQVGIAAFLIVTFDYITRHLLVFNSTNATVLHWVRLFLDIVIVFAATTLRIPRGWK
jgi:hypothetical protein